jgi:hypothetical protein
MIVFQVRRKDKKIYSSLNSLEYSFQILSKGSFGIYISQMILNFMDKNRNVSFL